jgi:hypothetical protein
MDLHDASTTVKYLIRDRDSKYTTAFDAVVVDAGIATVKTGIRVPRMNAIMERWVRTCRAELLDRTLIVNQAHLLHALGEYEAFYNKHRPHRTLRRSTPTPAPPTDRQAGPTRPARHPTTRPTRRHPPRIPTRRLSWPDDIFGTYSRRHCGLHFWHGRCVLGHNLRDAIPGRDFRRHLCDRLHRRGRLVHGRGGAVLVRDFLEFTAKVGLFATFLTPAADGGGDPAKRWDTARNAALSEILGFYGLGYWYTWQVTVLGLGPVWQSANRTARTRAAQPLADGHVMAFGLSERGHGADIYATDMVLTPDGTGGFRADGTKYYIGNGNVAGLVSVFGRRADIDGPDGYVFFAAASAQSASTTGASPTTPMPTSPTSRASESRPAGCARCCAPTLLTRPSNATWTSYSRSVSSSRSSSTASSSWSRPS